MVITVDVFEELALRPKFRAFFGAGLGAFAIAVVVVEIFTKIVKRELIKVACEERESVNEVHREEPLHVQHDGLEMKDTNQAQSPRERQPSSPHHGASASKASIHSPDGHHCHQPSVDGSFAMSPQKRKMSGLVRAMTPTHLGALASLHDRSRSQSIFEDADLANKLTTVKKLQKNSNVIWARRSLRFLLPILSATAGGMVRGFVVSLLRTSLHLTYLLCCAICLLV